MGILILHIPVFGENKQIKLLIPYYFRGTKSEMVNESKVVGVLVS